MMKVMSWKYKGMGNVAKRETLREMIRENQPNIHLLYKTKIEGSNILEMVGNFWKGILGSIVCARENKPNIHLLLETKIEGSNILEMIGKFWKGSLGSIV
jgi:hypothetical protein